MKEKARYVIFLHNGLGDLVMALPCLEVLKKNTSSDSTILVYVKCEASKKILEFAGLDRRFEVRVLTRKLAVMTCIMMRVKRYDWLLAPQAAGDWKMSTLTLLTGAKRRVGIAGGLSKWAFDILLPHSRIMKMHRTPHHIKLFELAGFDVSEAGDPHLSIPDSQVEEARALLKSNISVCTDIYVFSPGGKLHEWRKRWPAQSYGELANLLLRLESKAAVVVSGAPSEKDLLEEVVTYVSEDLRDRIQVWSNPDIGLSLGLFKLSQMGVTNCNGTSHLATAVGTPVVGLYGPTDPGNTGPYSSKIHVVRLGFSCSPCYDAHFTFHGCDSRPCMTMMTVERVYRAICAVKEGAAEMGVIWYGSSGLRQPPEGEVERFASQMECEQVDV